MNSTISLNPRCNFMSNKSKGERHKMHEHAERTLRHIEENKSAVRKSVKSSFFRDVLDGASFVCDAILHTCLPKI